MANQGTAAGETTDGHAGPEQGTVYLAGGMNTAPPSSLRRSMYAEGIANPLPELAVISQPEPMTNLVALECDDSESARPVVQPDDIGERLGSAVVYAGEKPTLWRKYRTPVLIALVFSVMVLVATVVGVLVHNNRDRSVSVGGNPSDPMTSASAVVTSTTTSSSTTATGSSVPVPTECADSSDFLTSVSFMGIQDAGGNGGWKVTYYGAKDSEDCCSHCYKSVSAGCNSWAYMPSSGFVGTSCAMITGWDAGGDKDSTCPKGNSVNVYFTRDSDNSTDVGAAGPCGVIADKSGEREGEAS